VPDPTHRRHFVCAGCRPGYRCKLPAVARAGRRTLQGQRQNSGCTKSHSARTRQQASVICCHTIAARHTSDMIPDAHSGEVSLCDAFCLLLVVADVSTALQDSAEVAVRGMLNSVARRVSEGADTTRRAAGWRWMTVQCAGWKLGPKYIMHQSSRARPQKSASAVPNSVPLNFVWSSARSRVSFA
jgi:hypothetical protein